ncbi:hypothetical protein ACFT7S_20760 [Streptomyces sp. NPDC057136]|uniref:hypothetical protein n=1 Tax=Streptomyces sp. NPDC057136 TaxID=3346029 RepID=UPI00363670E7
MRTEQFVTGRHRHPRTLCVALWGPVWAVWPALLVTGIALGVVPLVIVTATVLALGPPRRCCCAGAGSAHGPIGDIAGHALGPRGLRSWTDEPWSLRTHRRSVAPAAVRASPAAAGAVPGITVAVRQLLEVLQVIAHESFNGNRLGDPSARRLPEPALRDHHRARHRPPHPAAHHGGTLTLTPGPRQRGATASRP